VSLRRPRNFNGGPKCGPCSDGSDGKRSYSLLLNELAGRRVYERVVDMIRTMNEHLDEMGEENVNKEYFKSEEFRQFYF